MMSPFQHGRGEVPGKLEDEKAVVKMLEGMLEDTAKSYLVTREEVEDYLYLKKRQIAEMEKSNMIVALYAQAVMWFKITWAHHDVYVDDKGMLCMNGLFADCEDLRLTMEEATELADKDILEALQDDNVGPKEKARIATDLAIALGTMIYVEEKR